MKKVLIKLFSRLVITCLLVAAQLLFFIVEILKLQSYYVVIEAVLHIISFLQLRICC